MKEYRIKCAMFAVVSLILGFFIYIFLRHDTYIHKFLPEKIRDAFYYISCGFRDNWAIDFLRYYFVDYLWGISLAFSLCSVISKPTKKHIITTVLVAFVLGVCYEIAQFFSIVNGTFDFCDISMYATASVACAVININKLLRRTI